MKYVAVLSYVLCFVVLAFAAAAVIGVVVDARPAIAQCAMCGEAVDPYVGPGPCRTDDFVGPGIV